MNKRILLLGSGELGKEFAIAAQRLGLHVVAVDSYAGAPAMQVSQEYEVINMLDGDALDKLVNRHKPDIIVPEIEAIRTERLFDYEKQGVQVVPSARAVNYTMNRKAIRDLAAMELGLKTARYRYAIDPETLEDAVLHVGYPCVVKPLMSSSGKGQSIVKSHDELEKAWKYAVEGSRGDVVEVIVEEFVPFDEEITLLTVTQKFGPVLFCPPIGHVQERGDYQRSWMPALVSADQLKKAQDMAAKVTSALGGAGIWGVEFFLSGGEVYFNELSPRPHDTGMVTLAHPIGLNEFEIHLRAILGLPITDLSLQRPAASAVILANGYSDAPKYEGLENALSLPRADVRIFGKPSTRPFRRMGVALVYGASDAHISEVIDEAVHTAASVRVS
jgi:phosphoribosylglycinamide formyltransferase 2